MLQEGEGEHRHERMAVETLPGSPFEVIEAKFLFQLLMGLLANPSCLDGGRQGTQTGRCRQIGAHSSDRDQSFQAMVITVSMGS